MKSKLYILAFSLVLCFGTGCSNSNRNDEHDGHEHPEHEHENHGINEHEHEHDGHSHSDHEGEEVAERSKNANGDIVLEPEMAERFGVKVEKVAKTGMCNVINVSGVVAPSSSSLAVVTAPASGILNYRRGIEPGAKISAGAAIATINQNSVAGGNRTAADKANYESAKRELDRIKPLYDDRLVTAAEYNEAVRAYEQAKAAYSANAAGGSVTATISGVVTSLDAAQGQFVEAGQPIATVTSSARLTLRADVPEKYYKNIPAISDAIVEMPYSDNTVRIGEAGGKRVSHGGDVVSAIPGYIPVYFTFDNTGDLLPGVNVKINLLGAMKEDVISVPLTSLSEQQGEMFVFIRLDEDCYRKTPVRLGMNDGRRVEIVSGLKVGDDVVTEGTTTVRIAEASGAVPEGHTHNH